MNGEKMLPLRGAQICWHMIHDFQPFFGPGVEVLCSHVLKNIASAGLNCLLLEYETMYPYKGEHSRISCKDHFSREEISRLNSTASSLGIQIIPLVQTLGHVYHILMHEEYASLREDPAYIQQCCPSNPATLALAKELIDDVIESHPESEYIHLGGDECRMLGICPRCAEISKKDPAGKYRVYVDYYRLLTEYVISRGKKPILWHDIAVKVPEVLPEFSEEVIFHFWDYGDHCHGRLEERYKVLNSKVPAHRIIGGAGIRGEAGHGSLLLSPALAFDNIGRMNKLMISENALGSIVTDWPDGGTSWMNALTFVTAHGESACGKDLDRKWQEEFASKYFGVDIPQWFDRYNAVYGPIPFANGFQTQIRPGLSRYDFKKIDLAADMERIIRCETSVPGCGNVYEYCHRRLILQEWIGTLGSMLEKVTRNKDEYISFLLTFRTEELLLSLSLGHIMRYWDDRDELRVGYQLTPSLRDDDLARAGNDMDSLADETIAFYSRFSPEGQVRRFAQRLFKKEFKI